MQNFIKNNLCKVSRRRARDRNPSRPRPRRDLRPSRPKLRLQKTVLKTRLEAETKSRDSITGSLTWALGSLSLLSIRVGYLVTNLMTGRSPPKTCESNFVHHNFLQSGKQHSRYKAILLSIVLSQQCCEVYVISLAVAKQLWDLTSKYYWNRLP